jgi:flagellar FliL protein
VTDEPVYSEEAEIESRPGKGLAWMTTILVLAAVAIGCTWMLRASSNDSGQPAPDTVLSVLPLETFVVNLAGPDEKAYLRIGVSLGLNHKVDGKEAVPVALVRDTILGVLASSKPDDLLTPAGKEKLKQDVLHALDGRAPQVGVREVYFTEFLIQR